MQVKSHKSLRHLARNARHRMLRMHHHAGVGHIGGNLSCLDALLVLHHRVMLDEDRFVLSKGHAAGALYITLWSMGRISDDELHTFHGEDTRLPGHPPAQGIEEIRFATGSLGHGVSLAAGTALASRYTNQNRRTFCLTSDGEWQEGANWEALIFASHQRLNNLTILVDVNGLQGFGSTKDVASMQSLAERMRGFDVEVYEIDGHEFEAIENAISAPLLDSPRVILMNTVKGKGVPFMEGKMEWHYLPLNDESLAMALNGLEELEGTEQ